MGKRLTDLDPPTVTIDNVDGLAYTSGMTRHTEQWITINHSALDNSGSTIYDRVSIDPGQTVDLSGRIIETSSYVKIMPPTGKTGNWTITIFYKDSAGNYGYSSALLNIVD